MFAVKKSTIKTSRGEWDGDDNTKMGQEDRSRVSSSGGYEADILRRSTVPQPKKRDVSLKPTGRTETRATGRPIV
ncbi:hypothetical protein ASC90_24775 [Rhizobium sp. Root1220]|nr:hypothetical protein ASC90_24775 [Rhizobium sp. Root1220]